MKYFIMKSVFVNMKRKYLVVSALLSACVILGCSERTGRNSFEENATSNNRIDSSRKGFTFKNPALMAGTDLLSLIRRFYINQDYNSMLAFTSRRSINRFGERRILEFYKSSNFLGPEVKLKSIKYHSDSLMCTMKYEVIIFGTTHLRNVNCSLENDTAKLYLCNLESIFCK